MKTILALTLFLTAAHAASVLVCEQSNFKGFCLNVDFNNCYNFHGLLNDRMNSINTKGGCVELFEHKNCRGLKTRAYPGSPSHNDLGHLLLGGKLTSMKPC